jgi:biopolymer transport protein ExbB/TolQ
MRRCLILQICFLRVSDITVRYLSRREAWIIEITKRSLATCERNIHARMNRGLAVLATVASTAPLLGLAGTVFGIIHAFSRTCIGSRAMCMGVHSEGIAEALAVTAAGMVVAVPALWAYNYFSSTLNAIDLETSNASLELTNYLTIELGRRHLSTRSSYSGGNHRPG